MSSSPEEIYERLCQHVRETALLTSLEELVGWDERAYLPPAAGPYRAEQMTYLAGLIHGRQTDPRVGEWLQSLQAADWPLEAISDQRVTLAEVLRDYEKRTRLPARLVEELTRATVLGQQAWVTARRENDFASFAPKLRQIIALKQEQADAVGYEEERYDALLDDFEPGERTGHVGEVLDGLRAQLVPLIDAIRQSGRAPDSDVLRRHYSVPFQATFGRMAAEQIGFDFERGRIDETHHPFCAGMGPHDCRITTRYDERFFPSAFFGILHEAGHGLYDQGLPTEKYGLPLGSYVSLGIHESQSRMWENQVGRSRAFWQYFFPLARKQFPEALDGVDESEFYSAVNQVQPSLIRVEADEATYTLHICVRFELERALIDGDLDVDDLPAAWGQKYADYLGIRPPNDADGVLQDIHWSAGLIGYFPTYALGNLYAAQFFDQARRDVGEFDGSFSMGQFESLLSWLREKIHTQGRRYPAAQLVQHLTGQPLSAAPLLDHLRTKLAPLYGLD